MIRLLKQSKRDGSLLRWLCFKWYVLALLIISFGGGGCTTAWVQARRLAPTGLAPEDAIAVILTAPVKDEYLSELENQVTGCVQGALSEIHPDIRILLPNEFRRLVFPDLAVDQIPSGYFSWQSFLRDAASYNKIAPLGLRYVLAVNTEESRRVTDAEWSAATSMLGGPGPSLSWSWENEVLLEAIAVDVRYRRIAGAVHAYAKGNSGAGVSLLTFPSPFLLPHGRASFPFGVACRGLGEALAKFLTDEQ
ncbi:hypothetical protein EPO44_11445, partial [bacterium]